MKTKPRPQRNRSSVSDSHFFKKLMTFSSVRPRLHSHKRCQRDSNRSARSESLSRDKRANLKGQVLAATFVESAPCGPGPEFSLVAANVNVGRRWNCRLPDLANEVTEGLDAAHSGVPQCEAGDSDFLGVRGEVVRRVDFGTGNLPVWRQNRGLIIR